MRAAVNVRIEIRLRDSQYRRQGSQVHSITYKATAAHYDKLQVIAERIYHERKKLPKWKIKAGALLYDYLPSTFILIPLVLAFFSPESIRPWHLLYFIVLSLLLGYCGSLRHFRQRVYPLLSLYLHDRKHPQETTYRLVDSGVEIVSGYSLTKRPWDQYSGIRLTDDFILLEQGDALEFIPVETFAHPDDAVAFAKFASARMKAASVAA